MGKIKKRAIKLIPMSMIDHFKKAINTPFNKKKLIGSIFCKILRIIFLSIKGFLDKECSLRSSILTFYSLISLVPILAIIFSIAKGFGFEDFLKRQTLEVFQEQKEVISVALKFSEAYLSHLKSQAIVGIGVVFLFFSAFGLFENIEKSLNSIWNIKKHRGLIRRFINYLTALIVFPIFFICSTSITIFINTEVVNAVYNSEILKPISEYIVTILKIAPYVLMFILFSYIYIFTPNSKAFLTTRLFAGIIASVLFQFWQVIYIKFQVTITSYNAIYGSFAALPLFLIWLQITFIIFLFVAEIAAQIEGDKFFKKQVESDKFQFITKKHLTLLVVYEIVRHFYHGYPPLSVEKLSQLLGVSLLDLRESIAILENARIIAEVPFKNKFTEQYQIIVNPELHTFKSICDLVDDSMDPSTTKIKETVPFNAAAERFLAFEDLFSSSSENLNLKNFVCENNQ